MKKQELYKYVIDYFQKTMPDAQSELEYGNTYELLVAVILSAQCTDKRVNMITPSLFEKYPTPQLMARADSDEILTFVHSCSYPNSKAKHLAAMAKMLTEEFNGVIPEEVDELQKLPGVGRKTANVIASIVYNKPVFAVDTHVFRVSARIGLSTRAKTPLETEKQLTKYFPKVIIPRAHHWLILHGRYTCLARSPKCEKCGLTEVCRYYHLHNKTKK